jgi:hypothetical protein
MLDSSTDSSTATELIQSESLPSSANVTKLYQSNTTTPPFLNVATSKQYLNAGQNLVAHCGHGNSDVIQAGSEYLVGSDMYYLTNGSRLTGAFYSMSCDSADFVVNDCLAEKFVLAPSGGGFYIGNPRYGWYTGLPYFPYYYSALFERFFFQCMFQSAYNYNQLGKIHGEAKDLGVAYALGDDTERFILYELTLLGDPETPVWKDTPKPLTVTAPAQIYQGTTSITVIVKSNGANVSGATVCVWKEDEVYVTGQTGGRGSVVLHFNALSQGSMLLTVSKPGFYLTNEGSVQIVGSTLLGTVDLDILSGSLAGHIVSFEFRAPGTTTPLAVYNVALADDGSFQVNNVISGTYDITAKSGNWLRQLISSKAVNGPTTVSFLLPNGDADGSNSVSLTDLGMVLGNFAQPGPDGDLDWSGTVTLTDLGVVLNNFGLHGAP